MTDDARFDQALRDLEEAVASGSGARVLDALLAAWRLRRLPALTDAIEALSARYATVLPPIAGKTERTRYEQLLDLVAKKRSVDVGRIVAELPNASVIRAKDHTDRLAVMEPDPRVARALLDHVATRRYNLYNKVWTGIFRELRRHGDVRTREALEKLPMPAEDVHGGENLRARIRGALDHLPSSLPESEGDARRLASVRAAINGVTLDMPSEAPPQAATGRDEAALFEDMLAAPDDDAIRLVLADVYSERGDVRGELIQLQIKNARAQKPLAKDVQREKQIIKKHLLELLGPLEPIVDRKTCRFSRGFLGHAEVKLKTAAQRRELLGHPLLSTLESIVTRDVAVVRHPNMRCLRTVAGLSWKSFVELAHGAPVPSIRRVEIATMASDPGGVSLERLDGLPALAEASVEVFGYGGVYTSDNWSWLLYEAGGQLAERNLELVTDFHRGRLAGALVELDRRPKIQRMHLHLHAGSGQARDISFDIRRTEPGYHVTMRGDVYWYAFTTMAFEDLGRSDVVVEAHPPAKKIDDNHATSFRWLRERLGSRLVVVGD